MLSRTWPDLNRTAWDDVRKSDVAFQRGVRAICRRHELGGLHIERTTIGSLPVFKVGDRAVIKLFPPHEAGGQQTEAAALRWIEGRISIPTPRVIAADMLEGWPYVVMSLCPGMPLRQGWSVMTPTERFEIITQIGRGIADLHRLDVSPDLGSRARWVEFRDRQRGAVVDRQRDKGLTDPWLDQIEPFFADRPAGWPDEDTPERVVLHTEVMREHVFVVRADAGWRCSGLIDFEPAMVGPRRYELASVGLFVTEGSAALFDRFVEAYALEPRRGTDLAERCLAHALLHRYSNLPWYLDRLPPPKGIDTLPQLAMHWFGSQSSGTSRP